MLRSLLAIVIAVIVGLSTSKFAESIFAGFLADKTSVVALMLSWFIGATIAAALALIIGRRWAPLGALAAGSIALATVVAVIEWHLGMLTLVSGLISTGAGGALAIRLLNAQWSPLPNDNKDVDGIFND